MCVIVYWVNYCDVFIKFLMCSSALLVRLVDWSHDDWSLLIGPIRLVGPIHDRLCALPCTFGVCAACSGAKVYCLLSTGILQRQMYLRYYERCIILQRCTCVIDISHSYLLTYLLCDMSTGRWIDTCTCRWLSKLFIFNDYAFCELGQI